MRRDQSSTRSPSGVKLWNREPPGLTQQHAHVSSSCLIPADSVGWVTPQASAARPKCRSCGQGQKEFQLIDQCSNLRDGQIPISIAR
jgi:hypothetical protein